MRVVVAPDSFKGTISAADAAAAIAAGWSEVRQGDELALVPMADGGEGTIDAFEAAVDGSRRVPVTVLGPDGRSVDASWLALPDGTGVVELANTSGITLLDELAPLDAGTLGFGQAIAAALDAGMTRLLLCLGSSASTDGGAGVLVALGARLADAAGRPIRLGNRGLGTLARVDLSSLRPLPARGAAIISDVTNPLLGPQGAAAVFGPQKGASPAVVEGLESNLERWARLLERASAPGRVDPSASGAGAAGGTGFGLAAWGAQGVPGSMEVAAALGLPAALAGADLVITGEGRFDSQSLDGKVPSAVVALAGEAGARVALVAGAIEPSAVSSVGVFAASVALTDLAGGSDAARADAARWLRVAGAELARSAPQFR